VLEDLVVKACASMPLVIELAGAQLHDVDSAEIWQVCAVDKIIFRYIYAYAYAYVYI
jgi:hypothetical protein